MATRLTGWRPQQPGAGVLAGRHRRHARMIPAIDQSRPSPWPHHHPLRRLHGWRPRGELRPGTRSTTTTTSSPRSSGVCSRSRRRSAGCTRLHGIGATSSSWRCSRPSTSAAGCRSCTTASTTSRTTSGASRGSTPRSGSGNAYDGTSTTTRTRRATGIVGRRWQRGAARSIASAHSLACPPRCHARRPDQHDGRDPLPDHQEPRSCTTFRPRESPDSAQ